MDPTSTVSRNASIDDDAYQNTQPGIVSGLLQSQGGATTGSDCVDVRAEDSAQESSGDGSTLKGLSEEEGVEVERRLGDGAPSERGRDGTVSKEVVAKHAKQHDMLRFVQGKLSKQKLLEKAALRSVRSGGVIRRKRGR
jgi:hypothetical protein